MGRGFISYHIRMQATERRDLEDRRSSLDAGGQLRWAFAPALGEPPASGHPLVVGLHYGWEGTMPPRHGRDFLRVFLEPTFAGTGAVIAAPYCPQESWDEPRSVSAVLALLDHLLAEHPVDPDRVVLVGYSLGGMGTWYLGCRHPDRFLAGMTVAAVPVLYRREGREGSGLEEFLELADRGVFPWHDGLRAFPLTVVNSTADELMPYPAVERAIRSMRRRGGRVELIPLQDVGHYDSRDYVTALRPVVRELLGEDST